MLLQVLQRRVMKSSFQLYKLLCLRRIGSCFLESTRGLIRLRFFQFLASLRTWTRGRSTRRPSRSPGTRPSTKTRTGSSGVTRSTSSPKIWFVSLTLTLIIWGSVGSWLNTLLEHRLCGVNVWWNLHRSHRFESSSQCYKRFTGLYLQISIYRIVFISLL